MRFGKAASLGAAMAMVMAAGGINVSDTRANLVPSQQVQSQRRVGKKKNRFDDGPNPKNRITGWSGKKIRAARQKNGVGGPPEKCNEGQAWQMNKLHNEWYRKKFGAEPAV